MAVICRIRSGKQGVLSLAIQAHFLSVALLAGAALSILIAVSVWVFRPTPRRVFTRRPASLPDYGLLTPVALVPTARHAMAIRDLLGLNGIRATVASDRFGTVVLVFATDLPQARAELRAAGV
jgi:hypothetical protein